MGCMLFVVGKCKGMEDLREKERGVEREEASGDGLGMDLVDLCSSFAGAFESRYELGCLHAYYLHLCLCVLVFKFIECIILFRPSLVCRISPRL